MFLHPRPNCKERDRRGEPKATQIASFCTEKQPDRHPWLAKDRQVRSLASGRETPQSVEGIPGETSRVTPKAPSLWRLCVSSEAARLARKIHLSLERFNPSLACVARASVTPNTFGQRHHHGEAAELGAHDDLCEPGPGIWPLLLAKCQRWEEDGRSPGFRTFCPAPDKIKRSIKRPASDARAPFCSGRSASGARAGSPATRPSIGREPLSAAPR